MDSLRGETCCFSGYRIEKCRFGRTIPRPPAPLREALDRAIRHAAGQGLYPLSVRYVHRF